ncbi:hypothetical protein SAMN04488498_108201 [Mesorhizobium albiziae]|uniref:DUF2062 domain-containing protein n=1 Tax=Neomesorhizobium albiziae TaxID=335020 RepID=A0A1I4AP57_9HYPH|nr:DUF2062 domain-containing protein [Mesorhizobium albiziae]SFK58288.1 hypothetical protein SAMN04488498_108201 [Mesorhizobium albiziae]
MLFRRRISASFAERLRVLLWPRRSFSRSLRYFSKRALRLKATPHAVAAGVAAGVFASFFPLGFHFIIAVIVAWLIAGNVVAAALGTAFGNPLTFPLLWGASWETGKLILHEQTIHAPTARLGAMLQDLSFAQLWEPVLKPMTVGAVPLGVFFGLVFYGITRWGMTAFRNQRLRRMAERSGRRAVVPASGNSGSTVR